MKQLLTIITTLLFVLTVGAVVQAEPEDSLEMKAESGPEAAENNSDSKVVAYYFHSNRRCATCMKLEEYTAEAITGLFADQIEQGQLEWQVVNFEEEGNEHIAKDYQLISQSVILSRVIDGEETDWVNLDQIWKLVGDKEKYTAYIQSSTEQFINNQEK
ncbi:MAG: nitrophenyl compound nitroreductase subunit ArsF family protein [bacterium]|nr:nitrophenyl compound nitroreductase subunit ArsF family protein [bacterium]